VNGLAKGIASSKELFGTPCASALNPTRATLPINISTRIAPISQNAAPTRFILITRFILNNLTDVALGCLLSCFLANAEIPVCILVTNAILVCKVAKSIDRILAVNPAFNS
jgi:hypothetical protein